MINQETTGYFQIETTKPSFDSGSLNEQIVNALKACNVDMAQETMWSNILSCFEVVERRFSQYIVK